MRAIIEPGEALKRRAEHDGTQASGRDVKRTCMLCFGDAILRQAVKEFKATGTGKLVAQSKLYGNKRVSIISTGIGSPSAALVAEKMIACGARALLCIGFCGSISKELRTGGILVVDEAERGEGTSRYYTKGKNKADKNLIKKITFMFKKMKIGYHEGHVWTTDAIYRETPELVKKLGRKGCLGVDMETSGVYAVANYRKVNCVSVLVATDELFDFVWRPADFKTVSKRLKVCLGAVKGVLR